MEPYSGVALKAGIFLHSHYFLTYQPSLLFAYTFPGDQLVPIFLLKRVGGFSNNAIN